MIFNTIRIQLTLWFTGILALVLLAFVFFTYFFLDFTIHRQTDRTMRELSNTFVDVIESEQKEEPVTSGANFNAVHEALEDLRFRDYQIFVFDSQNKLISTENDPSNKEELSSGEVAGIAADFASSSRDSFFYDLSAKNIHFRIAARKRALNEQFIYIFVVHPMDEEQEVLERFRDVLLIAVPLVLILAAAGGYFLARKSLSPVASMTRAASQIGAANLDERLPVRNEKDELGNLATVFNSMLDRLENSFEQQRRFMADASHELRTPLAIVRGESEVALSREDRPPAELRESLEIVLDESKRLTQIVEDLFTLARADADQFKTNFRHIYADEILQDCVRKIHVLADKRNIFIAVFTDEMPMSGDEQLLRRLFMNMLDNAIKYNRKDGKVTINGKKIPHGYRIMISDTGYGISAAERPKIFDRFYRVDKARSRAEDTSISGAGLGLSIAQWIAGIHHAKIELVSSDGSGSTFAITFTKTK